MRPKRFAPSSLITVVGSASLATCLAAAPVHARLAKPDAARRAIDRIATTTEEAQRICVALRGPDPSGVGGGSGGPLSPDALQALRAEHVDEALLLLSRLLEREDAQRLAADVAAYFESGQLGPGLAVELERLAKRQVTDLKKDPRAAKIASALERAGIPPNDLLKVLRDGPVALDTSVAIVRIALRLAQGIHERVDQFASSVPWGLGGVVGWFTELVLGEILAVGVVAVIKRIESTRLLARSTEVARRACTLLEQDAQRPVIVNRMLQQLVIRMAPQGLTSVADFCREHPLKCKRLARRWGVRSDDGKRIPKSEFASGSFFDHGVSESAAATSLEPVDVSARLEANAADLARALEICPAAESCSFAQINYALSILMLEGLEPGAGEVPTGGIPEECVDCCEPKREPIVEPHEICVKTTPNEKAAVHVVVDRSASTLRWLADGDGKRRAYNAVGDAVLALQKEIPEVQVWSFPEGGSCAAPTAANVEPAGLENHLRRKPGRTYTPMRATLQRILHGLGESHSPATIIAVTDGVFNCPAGDARRWHWDYSGVSDVAAKLRDAGAAVHAIIVGDEGHTWRSARRSLAPSEVHRAADAEAVAQRLHRLGLEARCTLQPNDLLEVRRIRRGDLALPGGDDAWTGGSQGSVQLRGSTCAAFLEHDTEFEFCGPPKNREQ